MRTILSLTATLIAAAAIGATAYAADIETPTKPKAAPYLEFAEQPKWGGWYAGLGVGSDWLRSDDSVFTDRSRARPFGQLYGGYDWQFVTLGQAFVVGAIGDVSYSGARARVSRDLAAAGVTGEARQQWTGDAGMRLGWAPIAPVLFYVNGGASLNWSDENFDNPIAGSSFHASKHPGFGWFTGLGAEGYIQQNITLRAEYRVGQTDFSDAAPWRTLNNQRAMLGIAWHR